MSRLSARDLGDPVPGRHPARQGAEVQASRFRVRAHDLPVEVNAAGKPSFDGGSEVREKPGQVGPATRPQASSAVLSPPPVPLGLPPPATGGDTCLDRVRDPGERKGQRRRWHTIQSASHRSSRRASDGVGRYVNIYNSASLAQI